MDVKRFLLSLSGAVGISGEEHAAASVAAQFAKTLGDVRTDALHNLICTVKPALPGKDHVMLCAHMDEIGMVVTHILENGFLKVAAVGGVDRRTLLASPVTVMGKEAVPGVICSIPPHLQSAQESKKLPKMEELAVDIGYRYESACEKVALGDRVVISHRGAVMGEHRVSSKALDNRAGCAAVLLAGEMLRDTDLSCGVSVVLSTREELAANGAKTSAFGLCPTHAIAVDVSFGLTQDAPKEKCGELSKGPMVGISPVLSRDIAKGLIETAKNAGIPYQLEVMGGRTSTDADAIATAGEGVQSGLLSIPLRYMHTPTELIDIRDVTFCARLMAAYLTERWGIFGAKEDKLHD